MTWVQYKLSKCPAFVTSFDGCQQEIVLGVDDAHAVATPVCDIGALQLVIQTDAFRGTADIDVADDFACFYA